MTATAASPVTFAFDARITDVANGSPFNLPIAYQVGDTVHGTLTFNTTGGTSIGGGAASIYDQPFRLQLEIGDAVISSNQYTIDVFNNSIIADLPGSNGPADIVSLGCSSLQFQACSPLYTSSFGGEPFRLRAQLDLFGNGSILATPALSADPAVWNSFTLQRSLSIGFDAAPVGSVGFSAIVGAFTLVPEPSANIFAISIAIGAILSFRHRKSGIIL
jgi:hypothetical protein